MGCCDLISQGEKGGEAVGSGLGWKCLRIAQWVTIWEGRCRAKL